MALILHSHPQYGGTMNNPLVYELYHRFHKLGCTVVRFNFRGVGRSQGSFDNGAGELSDAAAVLDWMSTLYPNPSYCWVAGISFGAWIGMQLLDAPARNHRLHLHRAAGQSLRFRVSSRPARRRDCSCTERKIRWCRKPTCRNWWTG